MKKFLRKFLKVLLWIIGSIITIILLVLLLIQIPAVQNFIKEEAVTFLEEKIETPVRIDRLEIGFPKKIILEGFYFEDQAGDTLAAGERLAVNINFYKLISSTVDIGSIELEGAVANISRNRDSVFNFDYIAEAFATDQPQDTTATMDISIGTIDLDRIRFTFNDAISKSEIDVNLHHLDTRIGTFDPDNMIYEIPSINVDGLVLRMDQGETDTAPTAAGIEETTKESPPLQLGLGSISLGNIDITFNSEEARINTAFTLQELQAEIEELQMQEEFASLSNLEVTGLKGSLLMAGTTEESSETTTTQDTTATAASGDWKVKLDNMQLQELAFKFKDENAPVQEEGINFMDLDLTGVNMDAEDFYYRQDSISGRINSFQLQDHSGLYIKQFETNFAYTGTSAYLRDLYLETPHTLLRDKIVLEYPSLESLEEDLGNALVDARLDNSRIGFQDILLFAPDLKDTNPFRSNPNAILRLDGAISGRVGDLTIDNFEASGIGNTQIAITGDITGLPDAENASYNLNINTFRTTAADINQFVPPGTIPDSIQLPETFSITGNFRGTAQNFNTNLDIQSSSGNAQIDANIDMRQENAEKYDANIALNEFDLGRLIMNDSIGELTLNIQAEGTGFDPATASATASGNIERAEYNSYIYRDLKFEGSMANGDLKAEAQMEDPNLDFGIVASGNFQGEYPSLQLEGNIHNVALDSLNLYAYPLRFEGNIVADLETADPDHLNGEIYLADLIVENGSQRFPLDTISLRSTASATIDSLVLESQFLRAKMEGDYQLTKIGPAISKTIAYYYDPTYPPDTTAAVADTAQAQQFSFNLRVNDDPILTQLMPDLELTQPLTISGRYNSTADSLTINGDIPRMRYMDYRIVNGDITVETRDNALAYEIIIDDVESPQLQLFHTELSGEIQDNTITYTLRIDDSAGDPHYRIAGDLETREGSSRVSLEIEDLLLNYDNWKIPEDNSITFGPNGVMANNFELSHNNQAIRINSRTQDPAAPMDIVFDSFQIETISAMISKDTLLAGGTINGDVVFNDLATSPQFTSELTVENFSFKRDTVGNLQIEVDNQTANTLQASVTLTGQNNNMNINGLYDTTEGGLDFNIDITQLHIESVQGFSFGNISDGEGYVSGNLRLEGTVDEPTVLGTWILMMWASQ
ncbi:hypothetical protein FHG64_03745 [Antarcticibacterium flavum]|uniref:Translocation/assembly module TamB n=1 Tax=Antarcticibacterium flavum TaxID=2058175 RepID=A0A5B7WZU1_9FLAO|nr:hypothetical protein [Antarcticibacterium flavum]QCY68577.1 hypothetical protein FHG64_03745 [Antarcticibacterium flavum]